MLLVIFMTITPLTPKGLDAAVPQPPPPGTPPPPPDEVEQDDRCQYRLEQAVIKINQEEVENAHTWAGSFRKSSRTRNDASCSLTPIRNLLYNDVVEVIDIAKGAGVDKIGLMTEQISRRRSSWRRHRNR